MTDSNALTERERVAETIRRALQEGGIFAAADAIMEAANDELIRNSRVISHKSMDDAERWNEQTVHNVAYELQRLKEAIANRPDWEKLWAEVSEERDALRAQLEEMKPVDYTRKIAWDDGCLSKLRDGTASRPEQIVAYGAAVRLRAQLEEARAALQPFAALSNVYWRHWGKNLTAAHVQRAARALAETGGE